MGEWIVYIIKSFLISLAFVFVSFFYQLFWHDLGLTKEKLFNKADEIIDKDFPWYIYIGIAIFLFLIGYAIYTGEFIL